MIAAATPNGYHLDDLDNRYRCVVQTVPGVRVVARLRLPEAVRRLAVELDVTEASVTTWLERGKSVATKEHCFTLWKYWEPYPPRRERLLVAVWSGEWKAPLRHEAVTEGDEAG